MKETQFSSFGCYKFPSSLLIITDISITGSFTIATLLSHWFFLSVCFVMWIQSSIFLFTANMSRSGFIVFFSKLSGETLGGFQLPLQSQRALLSSEDEKTEFSIFSWKSNVIFLMLDCYKEFT